MATKKEKLIFEVGIEGSKDVDKIQKAVDKWGEKNSATSKAIEKLNAEQRELNKTAKLAAKAATAAAGSYDQLSAQYSLNRKQINGLSADYLENTKEGKKLISETAKLRQEMIDSQKATNNMTLQVGDYRDEAKGAAAQVQKLGAISGKAFGVMKKVGKASFKAIGTAIKGMGLGLLIGLLGTLFESMKQNQKVMDLFERATNAISAVISPLAEGVANLVEGLMSGSSEFDAFGRVIKNVITIALTPLKLSFFTLKKLTIDLQLGWIKAQKLFGKDVDTSKIEKLEQSLTDVNKSIQETKDTTIDAYKGIIKDGVEAFQEMKSFGKGVVEGINEAVKNTSYASIVASEQARKNVERLETARDVAHKKGMYDAEVLRQVRDDTTTSIDEQIQANKDLATQLEKQRQDEIAIVNQQIAQQEKILAVGTATEEDLQKMADLKYQLIDIDEDILGMMAEQQAAGLALDREKIAQDEAELKRIKDLEDEKAKIKADALKEDEKQKKEAHELELKRIQDEKDAKKEALNAGLSAAAGAFGAASSMAKEGSKQARGFAVAEAVANTAQAAIAAYTSMVGVPYVGPILAPIAAATAVGFGVKQVQDIKNTPLSFETGGIVPGNSLTGDKVKINVNSKEAVLNQEQQAEFMRLANGGGNGGAITAEEIAKAVVMAIKQIPVVITESAITSKQKEVSMRESNFKSK